MNTETKTYNGWTNYSANSSVWADLLGAALSEVNWHEIAQGRMESVDKGEEEESE